MCNADSERLEHKGLQLRRVRHQIFCAGFASCRLQPHKVGSATHVEYWIPAQVQSRRPGRQPAARVLRLFTRTTAGARIRPHTRRDSKNDATETDYKFASKASRRPVAHPALQSCEYHGVLARQRVNSTPSPRIPSGSSATRKLRAARQLI